MIVRIDFGKESDKKRFYGVLKNLKAVPYLIELKQYRDNRSNKQNAYYWGVVIEILSAHTGFSKDEMHEVLRNKFLRKYKVLPTGEEIKITKSTAELNTVEFENYLESIRKFSDIELGVTIPLPNEFKEV